MSSAITDKTLSVCSAFATAERKQVWPTQAPLRGAWGKRTWHAPAWTSKRDGRILWGRLYAALSQQAATHSCGQSCRTAYWKEEEGSTKPINASSSLNLQINYEQCADCHMWSDHFSYIQILAVVITKQFWRTVRVPTQGNYGLESL